MKRELQGLLVVFSLLSLFSCSETINDHPDKELSKESLLSLDSSAVFKRASFDNSLRQYTSASNYSEDEDALSRSRVTLEENYEISQKTTMASMSLNEIDLYYYYKTKQTDGSYKYTKQGHYYNDETGAKDSEDSSEEEFLSIQTLASSFYASACSGYQEMMKFLSGTFSDMTSSLKQVYAESRYVNYVYIHFDLVPELTYEYYFTYGNDEEEKTYLSFLTWKRTQKYSDSDFSVSNKKYSFYLTAE
jgi:hypothetical protein